MQERVGQERLGQRIASLMNSSIPQRVKVLLADDHRIVREGIRSCLTPYQLIEVIGEASDGGDDPPALVGFAPSGWWMAVVKTDHRDRDFWVYGGDGTESFRRRIAYVWGRIALGDAEHASPHGLAE